MKDKPKNRISRKALSVWRIKGIVETILLCLFPAGLFLLPHYFKVSMLWFWCLLAAVLLYGIWRICFLPKVRWNMWRYEVLDKEIKLLRGVFIVKYTLIPMARVQHVDTEQGPLYKKYGLTAVTISTAAGVHEIPAVNEKAGSELRDQIAALAGMDVNDE